MGGVDAARGFAFQHALALQYCLHAVTASEQTEIHLESKVDALDIEIVDNNGRVLHSIQAKTRAEPYTWSLAEVQAIADPAISARPGEPFLFCTNGQANQALAKALRARSEGHPQLRPDGTPVLANELVVRTRLPDAAQLIDAAQLSLMRHLHASGTLVSAVSAAARIAQLYQRIVLSSGEDAAEERRLTRQDIEDILGIQGLALETAPQPDENPARLDIALNQFIPREAEIELALSALLGAESGVRSIGFYAGPGFGKTTLARQLAERLRGIGLKVVLHAPGSLDNPIHILNELELNLPGAMPLQERAGTDLEILAAKLRSIDVLIIDGLAPKQAATLLLALAPPHLRVILISTRRDVALEAESHAAIPPLSESVIHPYLAADVGEASGLKDLVSQSRGWPLLVRLIKQSLRTHARRGMTNESSVAHHIERLRTGGPAAFDDDSPDQTMQAERAIKLALERLTPADQERAYLIGSLIEPREISFAELAVLWASNDTETIASVIRLEDAGLVQCRVPENSAEVHSVIHSLLGSSAADGLVATANVRFAESDLDPSGPYARTALVVHLAKANRASRALEILMNREYQDALRTSGGSALIARQATCVAQELDPSESNMLVRLLLLLFASCQRENALDQLSNIRALVPLLGPDETLALVRGLPPTKARALAHIQLGRLYEFEENDRSAADNQVRESLEIAKAVLTEGIPDPIIVTLRALAAWSEDRLRSGLEIASSALNTIVDPVDRRYAYAILSSELFSRAPKLATELVAGRLDELVSQEHIQISERAEERELLNLLPVLAYRDYEAALVVLDEIHYEIGEETAAEARAEVDAVAMLTGQVIIDFDVLDQVDDSLAIACLSRQPAHVQDEYLTRIQAGWRRARFCSQLAARSSDRAAARELYAEAVGMLLRFDPTFSDRASLEVLDLINVFDSVWHEELLSRAKNAGSSYSGPHRLQPHSPRRDDLWSRRAFDALQGSMVSTFGGGTAVVSALEVLSRRGVEAGVKYWEAWNDVLAFCLPHEVPLAWLLDDTRRGRTDAMQVGIPNQIMFLAAKSCDGELGGKIVVHFRGDSIAGFLLLEAACHAVGRRPEDLRGIRGQLLDRLLDRHLARVADLSLNCMAALALGESEAAKWLCRTCVSCSDPRMGAVRFFSGHMVGGLPLAVSSMAKERLEFGQAASSGLEGFEGDELVLAFTRLVEVLPPVDVATAMNYAFPGSVDSRRRQLIADAVMSRAGIGDSASLLRWFCDVSPNAVSTGLTYAVAMAVERTSDDVLATRAVALWRARLQAGTVESAELRSRWGLRLLARAACHDGVEVGIVRSFLSEWVEPWMVGPCLVQASFGVRRKDDRLKIFRAGMRECVFLAEEAQMLAAEWAGEAVSNGVDDGRAFLDSAGLGLLPFAKSSLSAFLGACGPSLLRHSTLSEARQFIFSFVEVMRN